MCIRDRTFPYFTGQVLIDGLVHLSEILYHHFNKKTIVLIDEFDAIIWLLLSRDLQTNYFPIPDVYKTILFMKEFVYIFLNKNSYVERGLINNCLQLSDVFFNTQARIAHLRFLENHPLVKYYGLIEDCLLYTSRCV